VGAARVVWSKARRSTGGGDNCVQVASLNRATIGVRDSKNPAEVIHLAPSAWRRLADQVKAGRYDL